MFLQNKYTRIYMRIIDRASIRKELGTYCEKHHIIPKSCGGPNIKDNKVSLSAKEHFLVHLLLTKMMISPLHHQKMIFAFHSMRHLKGTQHDRYISGLKYQKLKEARALHLSNIMKGRSSPLKGKKIGPRNFPNPRKGVKTGKPSWNAGKTTPLEVRDKIRKAASGRIWSDEQREACAERNRNSSRSRNMHNRETWDKIKKTKREKSSLCDGPFEISYSCGRMDVVEDLLEFADVNGYPRNTISYLLSKNAPASQGKCKGMSIRKL